jgi:hydrogenase maturation protease
MIEAASSIADGDPGAYETLILGIGNILWADEGFGIRAVEALHAQFSFPDDVRLMDGGTQGIFLLPWVRSAHRLLIFDAIDFGLPPASLKLIRDADVPRFMGVKKMSMHQTGFQEVLFSAGLSDELPQHIALIGVQPELLNDYGGSLRASVKAQLEPAIDMACDVLAAWGITPVAREKAPTDSELVGPGALDMHDYEDGRPSDFGEPL